MARFEFKSVSFTFDHTEGAVTVTRNLEGTVEGFGKVLATVRIHGIPAGSGAFELVAVNYPDSGPRSVGIGDGAWTQITATRATTTGTTRITTGEETTTVKGDGEYDLAAGTWTGTFD
jgi:hypothetical protein